MEVVSQMVHILRILWSFLNEHSVWMFAVGVAMLSAWNLWNWTRDRNLLESITESDGDFEYRGPTPKVSVLVAAWNESDTIRQHVDSFLRLRYSNRELVLCAGGDDGTYREALQFASRTGVVLLRQNQGEGKQRALQRCLEHASGKVIFLTDADCLFSDSAFERTLAPLLVAGEVVATGSTRPLPCQCNDSFVLYQWFYHLYGAAHHGEYLPGLEGRNAALWRYALAEVGEFRESVSTGTDYFLAMKLINRGYRIRFVYKSEVETFFNHTVGSYWKQRSRWIRNVVLHGLRFGAWNGVWANVSSAVLSLFVLSLAVISCFVGGFLLSVFMLLIFHGLVSRVRYMRFAELRVRSPMCLSCRFPSLLLFLFVDLVAWASGILECILPQSRWRW